MKKSDFNLEFPAEHGAVAAGHLWFALGEALRMLGETRGNDGWREELYDKTMRLFELAERTKIGDLQNNDQFLSSVDEAERTAAKLIDAAFDRIKFQ